MFRHILIAAALLVATAALSQPVVRGNASPEMR
jgi:hypothetical protein